MNGQGRVFNSFDAGLTEVLITYCVDVVLIWIWAWYSDNCTDLGGATGFWRCDRICVLRAGLRSLLTLLVSIGHG